MRLVSIIVLVGMLAACGEEPSGGSPPTTLSPTTTGAPTTTGGVRSLNESERQTLSSAFSDLSERTGVPAEDIQVLAFEAVTWNDGSLGCPEPGKMYTQALVDGWRMVLEADGTTYDYHAGADGEPFLCESPELNPGPDPSLTVPDDAER
ncbi:MAG TPA: hypothetical protein VHL52_09645 [Acidimicrobiia bacterium]|nr:hypothetical protein [Acidimicrobiia bacterium]